MAELSSLDAELIGQYWVGRSFRDTLYGCVRNACHVQTGTPVVVKEYEIVLVNSHLSFKGVRVCEEAQAEIEIHFRVSEFAHNNVLRVVDVIEGARKWYVVLEFCSEGELFNLALVRSPFCESDCRSMFRQIIAGVKHLHSLGVAHRDLSLENTLINSDGHLKISDFGVACDNVDMIPASSSRPGKYQYMSPEIFAGQSYSPSANDIWSCAVMLFILSVGAPPFTQPRPCEASFNLIFQQRGGVRQVADAYSGWNHRFSDQLMTGDPERRSMRPPPFRLSDALIDLLDGMFRPQAQRLTLAQIIQHPWMLDTEDIDDVAVLQQQRQMAISAANLIKERPASDDKSSFTSTEAQPRTPIQSNSAAVSRIAAQDDLMSRQKALFDRLWKASSQDRHRIHSGQAVHQESALQPRSRSHKRPANELKNSEVSSTRFIAPVSQSVLSVYRSAVAHSVVASQPARAVFHAACESANQADALYRQARHKVVTTLATVIARVTSRAPSNSDSQTMF